MSKLISVFLILSFIIPTYADAGRMWKSYKGSKAEHFYKSCIGKPEENCKKALEKICTQSQILGLPKCINKNRNILRKPRKRIVQED